MNLDKLHAAMQSPELMALFEKRTEALKAIEAHERELNAAREVLASIDAQITEIVGVPATTQARVMTCGECGEAGHNKRSCPNLKGT